MSSAGGNQNSNPSDERLPPMQNLRLEEEDADLDDITEAAGDEAMEGEEEDSLGPLAGSAMEAQEEVLKAKKAFPKMFVSGFDADDDGIEGAKDPGLLEEVFLKAAEDGDLEQLKKLVLEQGANLSYQDNDGYTALHRAAYSNHAEVIKFLVEKGAKVETRTKDGWTPLHCAAHWNSFKAMRELINLSGDVNAKTNSGQTALHISSFQSSRECMVMLLNDPKIDPSLKNSSGETAQEVASRSGRHAYLFDGAADCVNFLNTKP